MKVNKLELYRKFIHIFFGLTLIGLSIIKVIPLWGYYLLFAVGLILIILILKGIRIPILNRLVPVLDKDDYFPAHGMFFFYLSFIILATSVSIFKLEDIYILLPILIVTFADPAGYLVGKHLGKIHLPINKRKTLEGTVASLFIASLISLTFLKELQAILIAFVSMSMDLINIKIGPIEIDDNLLIPLAAHIMLLILI